jgi:hypothetical protein
LVFLGAFGNVSGLQESQAEGNQHGYLLVGASIRLPHGSPMPSQRSQPTLPFYSFQFHKYGSWGYHSFWTGTQMKMKRKVIQMTQRIINTPMMYAHVSIRLPHGSPMPSQRSQPTLPFYSFQFHKYGSFNFECRKRWTEKR